MDSQSSPSSSSSGSSSYGLSLEEAPARPMLPPRSPDASKGPFGKRGPRKGVLPKHLVRRATFAVVSLTIFVCGVASLLAVWDYLTTDTPWRALASLGIIAGTMAAFAVVNEVCGEPIEPMGG